MKTLALRAFVASIVITSVANVAIAEPSVKAMMKARHDHYHDLGDAFKTIRDQVRSSSPDLSKVVPAAQVVRQASIDQFKWFPKGTGPDSGIDTRAKAEIWSDAKGFKAAQEKFAAEAPKLLTLAQAKDVKGLQQQFKVVGQSCSGCHDNYRAEEDHKH